MSELLPCPFCGNEALLLGGGEYEGIQQGYTVECHNCSATTAYFGADNMQEAIEAWNTRTAAPSVVIETQELHNLKDDCLREAAGIVRCKDCKWFDEVHQEPPLCYAPGMCQHEAQPDGFCAWGELREGSE